LTKEIRQRGYKSVPDAKGTEIYEEKMKAVSAVNCHKTDMRTVLLAKARKRHFRNADTDEFNRQFGDIASHESLKEASREPPVHRIPERNQIIELICTPMEGLTLDEQFTRQCTGIKIWIRLQDRQESQRLGKLASTSKQHFVSEPPGIKTEETLPQECKPTQCPFCIGDESKIYQERTKSLSRVNKLWDHVENTHGLELAACATGDKPCLIRKVRGVTFTPSGIAHFKNHTQGVHKIKLRP
jgi:hypothetical protein